MLPALAAAAMLTVACSSSSTPDKSPAPETLATMATVGTDKAAEKPAGPWLWTIEKAGALSWIYAQGPRGTAMQEVPESAWRTLDGATRLLIDYRPDGPPPADGVLFLPETETLEAALGRDVYARLASEIEGRIDPKILPRVRPRFVIALLGSVEIPDSGTKAELVKRHETAGKSVLALRPLDGRDAEISRAGYGAQMVREVLEDLDAARKLQYQAPQVYRAGHLAGMRALVDARLELSPATRRMLNAMVGYLMPLLEPELARGGAFFASASGSLLMAGGVLDSLRARGFKVERMHPGTQVVVAGKAPRWTTPGDCKLGYERIVAIAVQLAAAKGQPLSEQEAEVIRAKTLSIASINSCLRLPLDRVECMKAAADRDAWTECLTAMVGQ